MFILYWNTVHPFGHRIPFIIINKIRIMSAVVYKTNQRTVWAGLLAAINIHWYGNFRGQKNKIRLNNVL